MEFISYFCQDKDGILYEVVTLSPRGTRARLSPKVLLETKTWLIAALVPLPERKHANHS